MAHPTTLYGHPDVMWTEEYQAKYIRSHLELAERKHYLIGMQVWNFADFVAVQSVIGVGGISMKGVFTVLSGPKMASLVQSEFTKQNL